MRNNLPSTNDFLTTHQILGKLDFASHTTNIPNPESGSIRREMSYLILIRHSISHQQPGVSAHEWTLTAEGIARCSLLAAQIQPYEVTSFASSPEPKAHLTAQHTAQLLNVSSPEIIPDLQEQKRETAPYYKNVEEFQSAVIAAMQRPDEVLFGEESFTDARLRLDRALETLMATHPDQTVAAVSHGTVMSLWLAPLLSQPVDQVWRAMGMPAYTVIEWPQKRVIHFQEALA
jgi:broad specificity phosphatase PhoE